MNENYLEDDNKPLKGAEDDAVRRLESMSDAERLTTIAMTLSLDLMEDLKKEVAEKKAIHLSLIIEQVEANYLEKFTVSFAHPDSETNIARVVRFLFNDRIYYHADYSLDGVEEGQICNMYRSDCSNWCSGDQFYNGEMLHSIGRAIDWHENNHPFQISYN